MKKVSTILTALAFLVIGLKVFGEVVTTKRKINNPEAPQMQPVTRTQQPTKTLKTTVPQSGGSKLANNIRNCRPYSETLDTNLGGVDFNFKLRIEGWVNNKCVMNFAANSTGINSMFQAMYGVDPSQATVMTFEPKVRCEFTKEHLQSVGESILQEEERSRDGKMLKSPADIQMPSFGNMSSTDQKLIDIVLNDRACKILNTADSNGMFDAFFGY